MDKTGFYIVKDSFFTDVNDPYLKGNKEENRPHYYCFQERNDNIYWIIPLSSRIKKYQAIIDKKLAKGKKCDTLHIAKLDSGTKSVFLIQDIFPITDKYIERAYTIGGNPLKLTSVHEAREIEKKARRVVGLLKCGVKFTPTQPDVIAILSFLKS